MKNIRRALVFALSFVAFVGANTFAVHAQQPQQQQEADNPKPEASRESYEIVLQLLKSTAPGDAASAALPSNLQPIAKKLRSDFGNGNYSLMLTLLNRVSARGSLDIKSVNPFGEKQAEAANPPVFYDFTLNGIKSNQSNAVSVDLLRFGIRLPITSANNNQVVNYEQTGITARPLGVDFNEPTVVGTLTTSRPNELLVLVMTVKSENRPIAKKN